MHTISPTIGYAFEPVTIDYLKSDDSKDHEEIEKDIVVINANARITWDEAIKHE